ncbi:MAG: hypothetical protein NTW59_00820 [Candidatus Diapherotrites archaeon]|nr:hypothetical protein [Candidatus Diapherotrites archaeon]
MRAPFFPYFFVDKKAVDGQLLGEVLSSYDKQKFKVVEEEHAFKVSASTFKDLNCLANLLFTSINFIPVVLQPERQFLLQQGWSYFDCFQFNEDGLPQKLSPQEMPKVQLPFFSEPLNETVRQLAESDAQQAERISETVALSNALAMPFDSLPPTRGLQAEALFENMFCSLGFNRQKKSEKEAPAKNAGVLPAENLIELDLSAVWPTLLTKPLFNIGFDSIDCDCCKPDGIGAGNILPNSTALVRIEREAFYFQSLSGAFAEEFHKNNPATRENRLRRMHDFCLAGLPVGPFYRNHEIEVPLMDAVQLERGGHARIVSLRETHWFCRRRESALSRQIFALHSKVDSAEKSLEELRRASLIEHGVLGPSLVSGMPDYLFQQSLLGVYSGLLSMVVPHLLSAGSAFYRKQLADSVAAVQANVLNSLQSLAEKSNSRVLHGWQGVFVRTDKPLTLIGEFSNALKAPAVIQAKIKRHGQWQARFLNIASQS